MTELYGAKHVIFLVSKATRVFLLASCLERSRRIDVQKIKCLLLFALRTGVDPADVTMHRDHAGLTANAVSPAWSKDEVNRRDALPEGHRQASIDPPSSP